MNAPLVKVAIVATLLAGVATTVRCAPAETPQQQATTAAPAPAAPSAETLRAREAVDRLREDYRVPLSFIESESDVRVEVAKDASAQAILDALTRSGAYRYEVIAGRPVLAETAERWNARVGDVAIRETPRMTAMRRYVEHVQERVPALAKLRRPGILGVGSSEPFVEPFNDESVTLAPAARVVEHLVQLLGNAPRVVFDVRRVMWGTELVHGVTFDEVAPLAFTPAAGFHAFSYYHRVAQTAGFAWNAERMEKALASPRPAVRAAAVYFFGLWQRKDPRDLPKLRRMLADPSLPVRLLAAEALLAQGDRSGLTTVTSAALHRQDRNLRVAGIRGAAAFAVIPEVRTSVLDTLKQTLADADAEIRLATVTALANIQGKEVQELLDAALAAESDAAVRAAIERARRDRRP